MEGEEKSVGCAKITCCNVMRSTNVMVIAGTPECGWHQIAVISRDVFAARCAILSALGVTGRIIVVLLAELGL